MSADIQRRLARVEAELAVRTLIADYAIGLDAQQADRFMSVWSADAVWVNGGTEYRGAEAIRAELDRQWQNRSLVHHWTTNTTVEVDEDGRSARSISDVHVKAVATDGSVSEVGGRYRDDFVLEDRRWRMSRREVDVTFRHHR